MVGSTAGSEHGAESYGRNRQQFNDALARSKIDNYGRSAASAGRRRRHGGPNGGPIMAYMEDVIAEKISTMGASDSTHYHIMLISQHGDGHLYPNLNFVYVWRHGHGHLDHLDLHLRRLPTKHAPCRLHPQHAAANARAHW
jgi:hypothetical protein